jgi:hypothetical protein
MQNQNRVNQNAKVRRVGDCKENSRVGFQRRSVLIAEKLLQQTAARPAVVEAYQRSIAVVGRQKQKRGDPKN